MNRIYDYAILGGGCSGLTLAVELLNAVSGHGRIAILESREIYRHDRIWCFWKTMPHFFSKAVRHEWHRWKVRHNGDEVLHASSEYPYQYVPADAFYEIALACIEGSSSADLFLQTNVRDIIENESNARIVSDRGQFTARVVFDGRNSGNQLRNSNWLLQHYTGQHIRSHRPVFDSKTVTLMDFDVSQKHGITFVYVLPFSETEALVEPTVFSHSPLDTGAYSNLIRHYLKKRFDLKEYDVVFQEQGIIPMTAELAPPKKPTRIIPIGTASGMVKGSTGYGFLAIQKWSRAVAQGFAKNQCRRLPQPRSWWSTHMDRIFLSFLKAHPSDAPEVFHRLFRYVPPNRLIRFLSDRARPLDIARVIAAMPKLPFIHQAALVTVARKTLID